MVRRTLLRTEAALGQATLRAMTLVERTQLEPEGSSVELAELHLVRLLGRVSEDRLRLQAARVGTRRAALGLLLALLALGCVAFDPFRIIEGLDVMIAKNGLAPVGLAWLDDLEFTAKEPAYLGGKPAAVMPFETTSLPRGSSITVRATPLHGGRALVLTDGKDDVPFVDDGAGRVVARWVVGDSASLRIGARFGSVVIRQSEAQPITTIEDEAPRVSVEGAPRTVRLIEEPSLTIRYEATDDHALRQIDLVLRASGREERRSLSRPQGETKIDRGGITLRSKDPFVTRARGPIEVTVEARDDDPFRGPKWGRSEATVILPPDIGEPEARRLAALVDARDALTDALADRLLQKGPTSADKPHVAHEAAVQSAAREKILSALGGDFGGVRLRGRTMSLVRGQLERLDKALRGEEKSPSAISHKHLLEETERVLYAFDAGVRGLATRDARSVAKRLAEVASEAASAAASLRAASNEASSSALLDASIHLLSGGGSSLLRLGDLGLDLGEIVQNDLRRVSRAREAKDPMHAELALRDLAARLSRPDPSFSSSGGGGVGESGSGGKSEGSGGEGEGEDADAAGAELARELQAITSEHGSEVEETEESLEKAASAEELEALKNAAREHADAIREAVKELPKRSTDPKSAESAAAEARDQAEAMAEALERIKPAEASDHGKSSIQSLDDAKKRSRSNASPRDEEPIGREAEKARETIARELAWLDKAREKLRKSASDRAKDTLDKASKEESRLSDRAHKLGEKGEGADAPLPRETMDRLGDAERAMREAAEAFKRGDGDKGVERQKDAQRMLEMAKESMSEEGESDSPPSADGDGQRTSTAKQDIPGKDQHRGPAEFRRRVTEGLGGATDPVLREAVKRYAEGLLR